MNWAINLSELKIDYLPHTAIKGQILANFIAEFTNFPKEIQDAPMGKPY